MEKQIENADILDRLPKPLKTAQQAIELPEVQEIIKKLSEYNLGVFMPHQHNEKNGDFEVLPEGLVQIENDLKVSFVSSKKADEINGVTVGWIWKKDGVKGSAACSLKCVWEISPTTGAAVHIKEHK